MIELKVIEGKSEEEVLSSVDVNNIHYVLEEQPGKLFKGKKIILKYVEKDDIKSFIKEYVNNFATSINRKVNIEIRESENNYSVMLLGDDNAIIIGKDGKTLNSLQLLLHQSINNITGFNIRINVDAGNYKSNKEKKLEREIKRICKEVCSSKIEAKLDPMNSYERRIVHNALAEFKNISTASEGEEPNRHIVIRYKEEKED